MEQNMLTVNNLTKLYSQNRGVQNLHFTVQKGAFHAFIGENGAGKTTTIKSIIGSYQNFSGTVLINELDNKNPASKKVLGYVPEHAFFSKELTTYEYLTALGKLAGLNKTELNTKIAALLKEFQITALADQKPYYFSSGQKKKVLLMQALLHEPELLILDEPTANLDPTGRYEFFEKLAQLKKEGKTIFISSHVLSEIDGYVDALTLIHAGQIVYTGLKYDHLEKIYYEKILQK